MAGTLAFLLLASAAHPSKGADTWMSFPYRGEAFTRLVQDSYDIAGSGGPNDFYARMDQAYVEYGTPVWGPHGRTLERALDGARASLATEPVGQRTARTLALCRSLHSMVKQTIPSFSFDRGFEFTNAVGLGERQCLLQSVLIASMLQRAGVRAGVIMVFRSNHGIESNNGHVVALVRLPDGGQVQVDASESEPFSMHPGVYVRVAGRSAGQFVLDTFKAGSPRVQSYWLLQSGRGTKPASVRPMDFAFVRSQFYFYRGERVPQGIMSAQRTAYALTLSAPYLQKTIAICPSNALAVYTLGKVHYWQGRMDDAVHELSTAKALYSRSGWVPSGCSDFLALATTGRAR